MEFPKISLPLLLTLLRLTVAPIVIPIICVTFLSLDSSVRYIAFLFFVLFALTDFLDGYFARKYNQASELGKLLDPLADKMLIFSTIVALVYLHKIYYFWAILFIGREFYIMGLREIALYYRFVVDVRFSGKAKTAVQSLYIASILIGDSVLFVTQLLVCLALFLTVYSAYEYTHVFIKKWKQL